eukprot:3621833-Alexandrium_andersonii.AAC.1
MCIRDSPSPVDEYHPPQAQVPATIPSLWPRRDVAARVLRGRGGARRRPAGRQGGSTGGARPRGCRAGAPGCGQ